MQVTGPRLARRDVHRGNFQRKFVAEVERAFVTRFEVPLGADLDIRIPMSHQAWRREDADFATRGQVVHVAAARRTRRTSHRGCDLLVPDFRKSSGRNRLRKQQPPDPRSRTETLI